ncbi:MAG: hypothetical protein LBU15_03210 [Rickettsiales bacterium]|nr:hypothetical protein [Rickettsiales bacterium]
MTLADRNGTAVAVSGLWEYPLWSCWADWLKLWLVLNVFLANGPVLGV